MNVLATFQNDQMIKFQNAKKIRQILPIMTKPRTYIIVLKNEFMNAKEAGSLNGPLCAYLMRQNLHDHTRPRS